MIALGWWGTVGEKSQTTTQTHQETRGARGQSGSARREPQENYTTGTKVNQADTSDPRLQGAVLQLPALAGSTSQQESLMCPPTDGLPGGTVFRGVLSCCPLDIAGGDVSIQRKEGVESTVALEWVQ